MKYPMKTTYVIFFYFLLSVAVCLPYHIKIVETADWQAPNSLNSVASFETSKPYQFRLLIPVVFKLMSPLYSLNEKYFYTLFNIIIVTLLLFVYYCILVSHYFENTKYTVFAAAFLVYPMLWNYVILNQTFQYYDFAAVFLFTLGVYFILKENFTGLVVVFIAGIVNKETAAYLIFAYIFYNYRKVLSSYVLLRIFLLVLMFISWKIILEILFSSNHGDSVEIGLYENIRIIKNILSDRVLIKNLLLNFGGLWLFGLLLFISGRWKKFRRRDLLFVNLVIVPYYIFGIFITYITEVRVYTELIPLITTLFLIFLSSYERTPLNIRRSG
jgi:hypothetical protein